MSWSLLSSPVIQGDKPDLAAPLRKVSWVTLALTISAVALTACGGEPKATPTPVDNSRPASFVTEDDVTLHGRLFGQGDIGVVLAHMFPADQTSWWDFAATLAEQGYMALSFDFRGYGQSDGAKDIEFIDRDVEAAFDFLKAEGSSTVFLAGASMGGTASLIVAARRSEEVRGVVSVSTPVDFIGISLTEERIQVPVLLMAADGDGSAMESLNDMITRGIVGPQAESSIYEESEDHGTNLLKGDHGEAVRDRILSFLLTHRP